MNRSFLHLLAFLLLLPCLTYAQKEGNIWYFGNNAGLDFNSGSPVALTNGALVTREGCATICDSTGKLQFYTDGTRAYNRNHQITPNGNGMLGNSSSTQSAVIVPWPGKPGIYYVFTVSSVENSLKDGMQYSIMDMSKNAGLGDITTKNQMLLPRATERVTAVRHVNSRDIWVIAHTHSSDSFFSFLVTPSGISAPVVSKIGSAHTATMFQASLGYLKSSSLGNKVAVAIYSQKSFEVFDFDNSTGKLSNFVYLPVDGETYGIEFSPDGTKLYGTTWGGRKLYQFNLSAGTESAIRASITHLGTANGAIQLAPDGKLYTMIEGVAALSSIEFPDKAGVSCVFKSNSVNLNGRNAALGLPTFIQSYFAKDKLQANSACLGDSTVVNLLTGTTPDSVQISIADSTGKLMAQSKSKALSAKLPYEGWFTVKALTFSGNQTDTIIKKIQISKIRTLELGPEKVICPGQPLRLSAGPGYTSYKWNGGGTDSVITVTQPGLYSVVVGNGYCTRTDTVQVKLFGQTGRFVPADTSLCQGDQLHFTVSVSDAAIVWSDGSTSPSISITQAGKYWVKVTSLCGTRTDTMNVRPINKPKVSLGKDTLVCPGSRFSLFAAWPGSSITWSNGSKDTVMEVSAPGKYWVRISNRCETATDTLVVTNISRTLYHLPADTLLCQGTSVQFRLPQDALSWTWQDNSTTSPYKIASAGNYRVNIKYQCVDSAVEFDVRYTSKPIVNLGQDTVLCSDRSLTLRATWPYASYVWQNGSTDSVITVNESGWYKATVSTICGTATDSVLVTFVDPPSLDLGNDTLLCLQDSLVLDAGVKYGQYLWQDGSSEKQFIVRQPGTYKLSVSHPCGTSEDDIKVDFEDCTCYLYVPRAFTPTLDSVNESFKPSICPVREYNFKVFNRWGECIFETDDIKAGWNGTWKGAPSPEGMFLYVVRAQGKNKRQYFQSGSFYLLR